MADESIGGVTVSIRGDASQLTQDFQDATQQARQAGEKIAAAFSAPASAANDLGAAVQTAGTAITTALTQPITATVDLATALANVKSATSDLADAQLQLGTFAAAGNQAAIATIAEYQTALNSAQAAVTAAKEAQVAATAATEAHTAATQAAAAAGQGQVLAAEQLKSALEAVKVAQANLTAEQAIFGPRAEAGNQAAIDSIERYRQALQDAHDRVLDLSVVNAGPLRAAMDDVRTATDELAKAQTDLGEFAKNGNQVAIDALEKYKENLTEAQKKVEELGGAHKEAGSYIERFADGLKEGWNQLREVGGELAAATGLLIGFTEAVKQSIEVFAFLEKTTIALTALTHSAETAKKTIEAVEEIAQSEALSFPTLLAAAQHMTAIGLTLKDIEPALRAAGDAAWALNTSVDSVTSKMEAMALSGLVSSRQMKTLGLSMDDLGKVMGLTGDEAKKAFKFLDESERFQIFTLALQKFKGVAAAEAGAIEGSWVKVKNAFEGLFAVLGSDIAPAVSGLEKFAEASAIILQNIFKDFDNAEQRARNFYLWMQALAGNPIPLALEMGGVTGKKEDSGPKESEDDKRNRLKAASAKALFEATAKERAAADQAAAALQKAIDDATERNELAHLGRMAAMSREAITSDLNLDKLGAEASIALIDDKHTRTIALAQEEVTIALARQAELTANDKTELDKRLAMLDDNIAKTVGHGKAGAAEAIRLEGEKSAAVEKFEADKQKLAEDVAAKIASLGVIEVRENKARLDEQLKDWVETGNKIIDDAQKVFVKVRNDARLEGDAQIKIAEIKEVGGNEREKIALQEAYARSLDHSAQAQLRLGEATLALDAKIVAAEVTKANLKLANDAKEQANSKVITQDQIALASAIDHQSTALAKEAAQLDHLRLAANRVHQVFVGLKADFDHAFQSLNHNLASAIVGAKSFHDAWQQTIKSVAESILNTLINAALGALEAAIVKVIVNFLSVGVSTAATNVASVMSYAAVAFAAAFASTAAIPIIGPALAPAAAAAAYATVAAESPLASFDKGGFVPEDMIAQIHKGEYIVPAAAAQRGIYDPHHGQDGGGDSGNTDAIVRALENNTAALKSIHTSVSTTEAVNATTGAVHEVKQAVESSNRDAITSGNVLHKLLPQTSTDVADSIKKIFSGGLLGSFFGGSSTSEEDANALAVRVVNFPKDSKGGGIFGSLFGGLLGGFAEGGWVNADMIAQVHKGEYVLTAEQAKGLQATGTQLPSLPSVHGSSMPALPNVSSSSSNSTIGEVKITVNGSQRPQETAREIARYLKSLSPKFSPAS